MPVLLVPCPKPANPSGFRRLGREQYNQDAEGRADNLAMGKHDKGCTAGQGRAPGAWSGICIL